jgi:hypothetical protein
VEIWDVALECDCFQSATVVKLNGKESYIAGSSPILEVASNKVVVSEHGLSASHNGTVCIYNIYWIQVNSDLSI